MSESLDQAELKRRTLSSLFWKFLERGGVAVGALVVQIVLARLLTPEDFGALALMLVFVLIGTVFAVSGFNTALVQVKDLDEADFDTVFWISCAVALTLWMALFVAAPAVSEAFSLPRMTNPLRAMGALFLLNSFYAVLTADVQRNLLFKRTFKAGLLALVAAGVTGIGSALCGAGLWALVIYQLVNVSVASLVLFAQTDWRPRWRFSPGRAKILFRFGWKLLVSGLLDTAYQSLADIIIGRQFSASSLGVVSQGKKYPQAVSSVLDGAIQPVLLSAVARVQADLVAVKALVRRALKTSSLVVVPLMALLAMLADPLVLWLLGEQWKGAVIYFQMFCFVYALWPIHTTNLSALNGVGRSDLFLKLEIVKKIVGLAILCTTVFCFHSPVAIVAGFMVSGVTSSVINAFPNRRVIGYGYFEQVIDLAPIWGLSLVSAFVGYGLLSFYAMTPLVSLVLGSLVFGLVFFGLGWTCRCEALLYVVNLLFSLLKKSVFLRKA